MTRMIMRRIEKLEGHTMGALGEMTEADLDQAIKEYEAALADGDLSEEPRSRLVAAYRGAGVPVPDFLLQTHEERLDHLS